MSLPRIKAHKRVTGQKMNILLDGLGVLLGESISGIPGQSTDTSTSSASSAVTSVQGANGIIASPTTGAVGLFDNHTPVQYYARRVQTSPQTFTITYPPGGGYGGDSSVFPVVTSDPKSQSVGNYGFDLAIGGIRQGDTFLIHARLTFQSPGAFSPNEAGITFAANSSSSIYTASNSVRPFSVTGIVWMEMLTTLVYFPSQGTSIVGPINMSVEMIDPLIPTASFTSTGDPTENFLEVFYVGFDPRFG